MSKEVKQLTKLLKYPKDFTFSELQTLLKHYGFTIDTCQKQVVLLLDS